MKLVIFVWGINTWEKIMKIKEYIREDLWKAIQTHYESNDYTEALRDASFLLKDILQSKSGEYDKDNSKLVDAVLSGQDPILKINNFSTQTEKRVERALPHFHLPKIDKKRLPYFAP
jgi:hypothetical protein